MDHSLSDNNKTHPLTPWLPTPAEIFLACKQIRARWTREERLRRQVGQSSDEGIEEEFGIDELNVDDSDPFCLDDPEESLIELGDLDDSEYFLNEINSHRERVSVF